jgi:hypothetical protein
MKSTMPVQAVRWVLLAGALTNPWAHATEPVTSAERGTQAAISQGAARSNEKPGWSGANGGARNAPPATAHSNPHLTPLRGQGPLSGTHLFVAKPAAGSTAHRNLLRKTSATTLSANANRPSGIFGTTGRSTANLKPASGNGVVGGPRATGGGTTKTGINGSSFHHRS